MNTFILDNKVARFHLQQNVRYELRDKFGNIKKLFVENKLGAKILEFIRSFVSNPIDSDGQVTWLDELFGCLRASHTVHYGCVV